MSDLKDMSHLIEPCDLGLTLFEDHIEIQANAVGRTAIEQFFGGIARMHKLAPQVLPWKPL